MDVCLEILIFTSKYYLYYNAACCRIMNRKTYKTIDEQIDHLVINKNVIKESVIKSYLTKYSYMNVVNPFTDLVAIGRGRNKEHLYKNNLDFNIFINLYYVDRGISINLREMICEFELSLKTFLSDLYCSKMSKLDNTCSDYNYFKDYESSNSLYDCLKFDEVIDHNGDKVKADEFIKEKRRRLIEKLTSGNTNKNTNSLLVHYSSNGYIPLWVMIRTLTISELLTLFMILNKKDKLLFIKQLNKTKIHYNNRDIYRICQKLYLIGKIRNIVNHYEPITPLILNFKKRNINSLINAIEILKEFSSSTVIIEDIVLSENSYNKENLSKLKNVINILNK